MPDSQNVLGWSGSNTSDEPRLVICLAPASAQSCFHDVPPSVLAHRPCSATLVMSMSYAGCEARYGVLPHSEGMPARLAVTLVHVAGGVGATGVMPPSP